MSSCRRAVVAVVAVLGLPVVAAPASAAVTTSNVPVPADPAFIHFDSNERQIWVQGTSDGAAGDKVALYCTNGTGASSTAGLVQAAVPVTAGGAFSFSGKAD